MRRNEKKKWKQFAGGMGKNKKTGRSAYSNQIRRGKEMKDERNGSLEEGGEKKNLRRRRKWVAGLSRGSLLPT